MRERACARVGAGWGKSEKAVCAGGVTAGVGGALEAASGTHVHGVTKQMLRRRGGGEKRKTEKEEKKQTEQDSC